MNKFSFKRVLLLLLIVILILLLWIRKIIITSDKENYHHASPPSQLTVYYTCDTRGHIEPCGCASGMAGGISRRQAYLKSEPAGPKLLVDAGDVTAGPRAWEMLELNWLIKSYRQMGYQAVNIGQRELALPPEKLAGLSREYDRFVSANVHGPDGKLIFPPYRVEKLEDGTACGIIGIVDNQLPAELVGKGVAVMPPADALARYLPEVRRQAGFIVLLAFAPEETMRALARQFYEIDVIIGGNVPQSAGTVLRENRSSMVYITDKGKGVGKLSLSKGKEGWDAAVEIKVLEEKLPRDPEIAALVEEYKKSLKDLDYNPAARDDAEGLSAVNLPRSASADRYVGSEACIVCHANGHRIWKESKHAHAFETLAAKGHQYNPRCLQCHTTGYMASDGYINERLTANLKNVHCEACHGRGDYHCKIENKQPVPAKTVILRKPDCQVCHDKENSPNFELNAYWAKITHGKD